MYGGLTRALRAARAPRGSKWLRQFRAAPLKNGSARGGDSAGGAIASGSAKFPAEGFCPQRAPPKSPQKTPRDPQNDSPNEPN